MKDIQKDQPLYSEQPIASSVSTSGTEQAPQVDGVPMIL